MMPPMNAIGVNTTRLVSVAAATATAISDVPRAAASGGRSPASRRR
jgi:hypothetical protein